MNPAIFRAIGFLASLFALGVATRLTAEFEAASTPPLNPVHRLVIVTRDGARTFLHALHELGAKARGSLKKQALIGRA